MAIIRRKLSHEYRFTQVPNEWIRDRRLSLKAKGLLAQLLSHANGYNVSINRLASVNSCGRDLIRGAVEELEAAGYLERLEQSREGGKFSDRTWVTSEPSEGLPSSGNPTSVKPTTVNPTTKKTNSKNTNFKKTNSKEEFEFFYNLYPRKVGKPNALRSFEKALESSSFEEIIEGTKRLANDPNLPEKQFIPHPATWLNREGWNDEPYPSRDGNRFTKPAADIPGKNTWKLFYHDQGDHSFCKPGDFDCMPLEF